MLLAGLWSVQLALLLGFQISGQRTESPAGLCRHLVRAPRPQGLPEVMDSFCNPFGVGGTGLKLKCKVVLLTLRASTRRARGQQPRNRWRFHPFGKRTALSNRRRGSAPALPSLPHGRDGTARQHAHVGHCCTVVHRMSKTCEHCFLECC